MRLFTKAVWLLIVAAGIVAADRWAVEDPPEVASRETGTPRLLTAD